MFTFEDTHSQATRAVLGVLASTRGDVIEMVEQAEAGKKTRALVMRDIAALPALLL
ncbi:hypothetical protein [Corallococcus carmarthensis]|uniref:hypothetical protein n=1 Tax=Corallococcus carmarthensis TaxID=2316728 RepID=UPI0013151F83|nr:hypothetical protein [Corallococcus carmarthensis]